MNREIEKKIFDIIYTLSTCLAYERKSLSLLDHLNDVSRDLVAAKKLAAQEIQDEVNDEAN